ncbi:LytTR family transcriptional regulator [Flavobacteriaceae bacterium R38]|nr:LytTR family transcriptional regulator [Flavobacteriaceae bacterium R38]
MRKDRLYFYTFLAITVIFIIIAGVAVEYLVKVSANQLIEIQLESSKREAKEIASMAGYQLESGLKKEIIIQNIQFSIQNTNLETGFVSMFDWSGIEICHPDITRVGQQIEPDKSSVSTIDGEINSEDFYDLLISKQQIGGIRDFNDTEGNSEVIYLYPVANSDWIVGAHANITKILNQIKSLRNKFYIIFVIMGFVVILSSVITVRLIGSFYEKKLEAENKKLEGEVINLAKLNKAIDKFQQKASSEKIEAEKAETEKTPDKNSKEKGKKRILTYLRHEILTVATEDIAYIYTENTITYVVDVRGKKSTVNSSLDELQSNLDPNLFYRANRQFIISIIAIEKIIRYGNNQLKILMKPSSEIDITIGKNKASEFKQWLNL